MAAGDGTSAAVYLVLGPVADVECEVHAWR